MHGMGTPCKGKGMDGPASIKKVYIGNLQTFDKIVMKIIDGFRLRDVMGQATVVGEGVNQVNFSKLVVLNSSAAFLWKMVEGKEFDVEMLADMLVGEYGIDKERALDDAKAISDKWVETGLAR